MPAAQQLCKKKEVQTIWKTGNKTETKRERERKKLSYKREYCEENNVEKKESIYPIDWKFQELLCD